jgi:hypothetical protein
VTTFGLNLSLIVWLLTATDVSWAPSDGGEATIATETPFAPDPQHPWNRLYRVLYTRTAQDGSIYDQEGLDPVFRPASRFLTEGASHDAAIKALDQFLDAHSGHRISDPLKRAILQRDLWAVFNTTTGETCHQVLVSEAGQVVVTDRFVDQGDEGLDRVDARRALQRRLVQAMRLVALDPTEIERLSDNLADAVKSGEFPAGFDPDHPQRPFLSDLLRDRSWVAVSHPERSENNLPAAPEHVAFTKGRSAFVVLLRLPGGREETEDYLQEVQRRGLVPFPTGTQTALVRRTLLIDRSGSVHPSPLTESVQIRIFRRLDTGDPLMFTLRRSDLFAGRHGGLRAVEDDETSYFDFQVFAGDVFESANLPPALILRQTCTSCHARSDGRGGIYSVVSSSTRGLGAIGNSRAVLVATEPRDQFRATIEWLRQTYSWGLLQGLWQLPAEGVSSR